MRAVCPPGPAYFGQRGVNGDQSKIGGPGSDINDTVSNEVSNESGEPDKPSGPGLPSVDSKDSH